MEKQKQLINSIILKLNKRKKYLFIFGIILIFLIGIMIYLGYFYILKNDRRYFTPVAWCAGITAVAVKFYLPELPIQVKMKFLINKLQRDIDSIVWIHIMHGMDISNGIQNFSVVFCDNRRKTCKINFGNRIMAEELLTLAKLACPHAIMDSDNILNYKSLKKFYKKEPDKFLVYLKSFKPSCSDFSKLSLEECKNKGKRTYITTEPANVQFMVNDIKSRLVMGLAARFLCTDRLYDVFLEFEHHPVYREFMKELLLKDFYGLEGSDPVYPKRVRKVLSSNAKETLKNDWGITTSEHLYSSLEWIYNGGQRDSLSIREKAQLKQKFPKVTTTAGFDISRYVNLLRLGLKAKLLTQMESEKLLNQNAYNLFTKYFKGYDGFIESDLAGIYIWGGQEKYNKRLHLIKALYLNPYSPLNQLSWNKIL